MALVFVVGGDARSNLAVGNPDSELRMDVEAEVEVGRMARDNTQEQEDWTASGWCRLDWK